jgi:hypothetical protein
MTRGCRKFCVLTTGRSGSTWLMQALERFPDVALPKKQIDCIDNELLRPGGFGDHCSAYAALTDAWVSGQEALIETFYWHSAAARFAGFKSMPHRHESYDHFLRRSDIRFITLERADIASTVASFLLAMRTGTWRRHGAPPPQRWTFRPEDSGDAKAVLARLLENRAALARVPNAIGLTYEELCSHGFASPELDHFFERPIRFGDPKPPVSGAAYTENWDDFLACLDLPGSMEGRAQR